MDNPKRSGVHNAANSRDGVKNTIVLISTISIVYMATMHSTICALDQGLEPKTIARGKTIQRIVHKTRTIGQEDKRETTWTQSITTSAGETLHIQPSIHPAIHPPIIINTNMSTNISHTRIILDSYPHL